MKKEDNLKIESQKFSFYDEPMVTINLFEGLYANNGNRSKYINWGEDNLLPLYYMDLVTRSALHNAIVNGKANMISGNGWDKTNMSPEMFAFWKNQYGKYNLDEIGQRIGYDSELFGNFALTITWQDDTIKSIGYIEPHKIRVKNPFYDKSIEEIGTESTYVMLENEKYYISNDWTNQIAINTGRVDAIMMDAFKYNSKGEVTQLLFTVGHNPAFPFYGCPGYASGLNWIEMEPSISRWHLSNIKKGFAPSLMFTFVNGSSTPEERQEFLRNFKDQLAGEYNAGDGIINFVEDKDKAPILDVITNNDNDSKFIDLTDTMRVSILNSHWVNDPSIFGINDKSNAIIQPSRNLNSLEEFQALYVNPRQKIIEDVFNRLARINGIKDKLILNKYKIKYNKTDLTTGDLLSILSSEISRDQKIAMLSTSGYTQTEAEKLVGEDLTAPINPAEQMSDEANSPQVNNTLTNLTGRQKQHLDRILRQFDNGKLSRERASVLLRSSFGLTDDDIDGMLGPIEEDLKNNTL